MTIAIIAHNGKKAEMVQFLNENKEILHAKDINIIATGNTGNKTEAAGFKVEKLHSGPLVVMHRSLQEWWKVRSI